MASPPSFRAEVLSQSNYVGAAIVCSGLSFVFIWLNSKLYLPLALSVSRLPQGGSAYGIDLASLWVVGVLPGFFIAMAYRSPFRVLGLVPIGTTIAFAGTLITLCYPTFGAPVGWLVGACLGLLIGITIGVLITEANRKNAERPGQSAAAPSRYKWRFNACVIGLILVLVILDQLLSFAQSRVDWELFERLTLAQMSLISGVSAVVAWWRLRRPFVELVLEPLFWPFYRVRAAGPGVGNIPPWGPCLIISNHAAYLDPLFLAKIVPRPITPMMTATFFDKPIIRHLMLYVFDTIRVPETAMKRDANELAEAIAALDAGKCVVIFPEGYLRRRDDQPLRRFGRGVWEILRARPDTPVVACWIEGGWGSYFSFKDGPPTKNKPRDFRRRIGIGVSVPERVPTEVLQDHYATRFHLMERVLKAREHLGRHDLPAPDDPSTEG